MMPKDYTSEASYKATRRAVERATTLLPDSYREPEFHKVEQDRLWGSSWVCIGYTSQLEDPGQMIRATVGGQPLVAVRDKGGNLRCFYNVCRHRGSQLVVKDCKADLIRCPYHSWAYSLDGKLLGTPYFKGLDVPAAEREHYETNRAEGFRKEDFGLLPVKIESWGCFVFVNLDDAAMPLASWLGDLPVRFQRHPLHELTLVRRQKTTLKANWKLVAENFMEYYHLPTVHPELCKVSGVTDHHRYQGPGMYTGMCTSPLSRDGSAIDPGQLPAMPGLSPVEAESAYWIMLFPNVALFLLPNHLFTLLLTPVSTDETEEWNDILVHPDTLAAPGAQEKIDQVLAYWDMVNRQDVLAVERVQMGLAAKAYPGGRMCYHFEEPVHRFQNMVIDRMTGAHRVPQGDREAADQGAAPMPLSTQMRSSRESNPSFR